MVERAIHSALNQTWDAIEIVVVDDASSDGTLQILHKLATKHKEIRVFVNHRNAGVAVSRNRIIEEAHGEFIVFFDDDDESLPDRIEKQLARIEEYEARISDGGPVICHTAREVIFPDGASQVQRSMGDSNQSDAPAGLHVARYILLGLQLPDGSGGGAVPTCSQMARLGVYQAAGGFDPEFRRSEDTEFAVRLALAGGHFVGISQPLVRQYMTLTKDKSLAGEALYQFKMLEKYRLFLEGEGRYDFARLFNLFRAATFQRNYVAAIVLISRLILQYPILTVKRMRLIPQNFETNMRFMRFHRRPR